MRKYLFLIIGLFLIVSVVSAYPRAIAFAFDDGLKSQYDYAYPIFAGAGINGTCYVITNNTGTANNMTVANLTTLYNAGWDISDHTLDHTDLTTLSLAQQQNEILEAANQLNSWGFTRSSNNVAYPSGNYNADTLTAMINTGMLTGRIATSGALGIYPTRSNNGSYKLGGVNVIDSETQIEADITKASTGSIFLITIHDINQNGDAGHTNATALSKVVNWTIKNNIPIITISQLNNYDWVIPTIKTVYVADPGSDGKIEACYNNQTFLQARTAIGNFATTSEGTIPPTIQTDLAINSFYYIIRGAILINSNNIRPTNGFITSGIVGLHWHSSHSGLGDSGIGLTKFLGSSIIASNYNNYGIRIANDQNVSSLTIPQYYNFTLTPYGISTINNSGITGIGVQLSNDIDNITPTWIIGEYNNILIDSIDHAPPLPPYLEISVIIPPVASFSTNSTTTSPVQFLDTSINASFFNWTFGDGTFSSLENPIHTYSPGTYQAFLTSSNSAGSNQTVNTFITIAGPTTSPTPTPTAPPTLPTPTPVPTLTSNISGLPIYPANITCYNQTGNIPINKIDSGNTWIEWGFIPLNLTNGISIDGVLDTKADLNGTYYIAQNLAPGQNHIIRIMNATDYGQQTCYLPAHLNSTDQILNLISDWFPVFIILLLFMFGLWLHWLIFFIGSGVSLFFLYDWIQRYPIQTAGITNLHFLIYAALFILGLILWLFSRKRR